MLASIVSVFLFMEFWWLMFGHMMKGGLRMDLSCITGTFSVGQRMLSHRKWSFIKEEEIVRSLFLHAIKFYFPPPQKTIANLPLWGIAPTCLHSFSCLCLTALRP
jgi:hypothetical protein